MHFWWQNLGHDSIAKTFAEVPTSSAPASIIQFPLWKSIYPPGLVIGKHESSTDSED